MIRPHRAAPLALLAIVVAGACTDVPVDGTRSDRRLLPARGAIRGTFRYDGPPPCSENGHVVGGAVIAVYSATDLPPPAGVATAPVNFVYLPGDVLFPSLPRTGGARFCPDPRELVTATAPYAISPLEGGAYQLRAFYNRSGDFLPTFGIRSGAEAGDLRGGYIDSADALVHRGDPEFSPRFLPVEVGLRAAGDPSVPDAKPTYLVPTEGFLADDIPVTVTFPVPFPRPYFYATGADVAGSAPILRITQDATVLAAPGKNTSGTWAALEASYPKLPISAFFPAVEADSALGSPFLAKPFSPANGGGLQLTATGREEALLPGVPLLQPRLDLVRLDDTRTSANGFPLAPTTPRVVLGGFALDGPLETTVLKKPEATQGVAAARSALNFLVRPVALCTDPNGPSKTGILVTPRATAKSADASEGEKALYDRDRLLAAYDGAARAIVVGCLPKGRYAITLSYSNGQAWTTPNEAGSCVAAEGAWDLSKNPAFCAEKMRPVLRSQGARGVVEIVAPTTAEGVAYCAAFPPPDACNP